MENLLPFQIGLPPLMVLNLMNKTTATQVSSQISMAIKRCLGVNQCLSKDKLYAWLYELTPLERAELSLLRLLKKLRKTKLPMKNIDYFLNKVTSCKREEMHEYFEDQTTLSKIKESILQNKTKTIGLKNGKPFESLNTSDLNWLRFTTKEIDIYRWKGKTCMYCNGNLSTDHLLICVGTKKDREDIKVSTGIDAGLILKDPSLLNEKKDKERKSLKSFVAKKISKMIFSAERRALL
ncbi:MAG TPA: hypothetical protein PLS50_03005 [Candidatus Dojkabacteria bacterium]|nr:hypothetical protein [Candidatus Dojkabacteria bacterium]